MLFLPVEDKTETVGIEIDTLFKIDWQDDVTTELVDITTLGET